MVVRYENLSEIVQADNLACLELYHSNGSDMQAVNENGESGLIEACRRMCSNDLVEYLLRQCDVHATDHKGRTALFWAAYYGTAEHVKMLLEFGAQTDVCNNDGTTPLMAASRNGCQHVAILLLDSNANSSMQDKYGYTALHWCVAPIIGAKGPVDGNVAAFAAVATLGSPELPQMRNEDGDTVYDLIHKIDDENVANKLLRILQNSGGTNSGINITAANTATNNDISHHNTPRNGSNTATPDAAVVVVNGNTTRGAIPFPTTVEEEEAVLQIALALSQAMSGVACETSIGPAAPAAYGDSEEIVTKASRTLDEAHDATDENPLVENECKICFDAKIDCVILDCGHLAVCYECGDVLDICPICRSPIARLVRTYRA